MGSAALHARALAMLAASRLSLGRRGTTWTLRRLSGSQTRQASTTPLHALKAVRRAARVLGGACLPQAVALTALLQRDGHQPILVLGCRMGDDRVWSAHAWVQVDDLVLEPVPTREHASLAHLNATNGWVPSPLSSKDR